MSEVTGEKKIIPIKKVHLTDHAQLPAEYSATPGGTIFSTTPGGTRIVYERDFLLQCRNSPLSKTPPANLPNIPGVTQPPNNHHHHHHHHPRHPLHHHNNHRHEEEKNKVDDGTKLNHEDQQFQMDI